MIESIWQDMKREFQFGNMVTRIIIINVAVFVLINLVRIIMHVANGGVTPDGYYDFLHFFCFSADGFHLLTHPWTLVTSVFLHEGFWHLLWNMLFLFWFGRIVGDFIGNQRILPIYLLGGIVGSIAYFITANILPYGGYSSGFALGASAGVMAMVVAAGVISPDYIMRLLFLGDVKLKYIVAVLVFLDMIGMAGNINTGGHFAHLGGAAFGWFFVWQLRNGTDYALPVNQFIDKLSSYFKNLFKSSGKGPKVAYRNPKKKKRAANGKGSAASDSPTSSHQEQLDAVLDKIRETGYDSLTEEEKEFLFNASKK